jgi:hypothetical protein
MLLIGLTSLSQQKFTSSQFKAVNWLQGSWKGMAGKEPFYEAWRLANDSTFVNLAIEIKNGDTLLKEAGALVFRDGKIFLGQKATQWTARRMHPNEIVLQNDTLRFSNTIIWLRTNDDQWLTILEHPGSTVYYDMTKDAILDRKVEAWIASQQKKKN